MTESAVGETPGAVTAGGTGGTDATPTCGLAGELGRLHSVLHVLKQRTEPSAEGVEWGAAHLLGVLVGTGPCRQLELADTALLDASTVSRRVAQLVRAGLVERQADPDDGRAVRLVPTDAGRRLAQRLTERRLDLLTHALESWSGRDIDLFTTLLRRFTDDVETGLGPTQPRQDQPR